MKLEHLTLASSVTSHDASVLLEEIAPKSFSYYQYLLKDGDWSSKPVYGQEKGVFVNPTLVMDLQISRAPMTAEQALAFYKLKGLNVPTLYQALLLQLNVSDVEKRLADIGMSGAVGSNPFENVWYDHALTVCPANETRLLVSFTPHKDYVERDCTLLGSKDFTFADILDDVTQKTHWFLVDKKYLLALENGKPRPLNFQLLGSWNSFDLLGVCPVVEKGFEWLFFRNRETLEMSFYILTETYDQLNFVSDELFSYGKGLYQALNGEIKHIHTVDHIGAMKLRDGVLEICYQYNYYSGELPEHEYLRFVKGEDGYYTEPVK